MTKGDVLFPVLSWSLLYSPQIFWTPSKTTESSLSLIQKT